MIISKNTQCPDNKYTIGVDILSKENNDNLKYHISNYQKYFVLSDTASNYLLRKVATIIGDKKNILGVICRGTDYLYKKPAGHPVQPQPEQIIEKIAELKKRYQIEWIYLATEDSEILNLFKRTFKDNLLFIDQKRFNNEAENFICDYKYKDGERVTMNLDYLTSMHILSKCDYLIGGRTSGTIAANLMSRGFKYHYYWDLGTYPYK